MVDTISIFNYGNTCKKYRTEDDYSNESSDLLYKDANKIIEHSVYDNENSPDQNDNQSNKNGEDYEFILGGDKKEDGTAWYLSEIRNHELLTAEEERSLVERYHNGDLEARNRLVGSNLKLVIMFAKRYLGVAEGLTFDDLIQEGNLGLMRAVETFDPDRGRFTTYASNWINQSISRALYNSNRLIRIPVHHSEKSRKYVRAKFDLEKELNREPTIEEIADRLEISVNEAKEWNKYLDNIISLDLSLTESEHNEEHTLLDILHGDERDQPDYIVEQKDLRDQFEKMFDKCLSEKEKDVICKRFGFYNNRPMTLEEVGEDYNVTRERIRQVEAKAIKKLRQPWNSKMVSDFVDR